MSDLPGEFVLAPGLDADLIQWARVDCVDAEDPLTTDPVVVVNLHDVSDVVGDSLVVRRAFSLRDPDAEVAFMTAEFDPDHGRYILRVHGISGPLTARVAAAAATYAYCGMLTDQRRYQVTQGLARFVVDVECGAGRFRAVVRAANEGV